MSAVFQAALLGVVQGLTEFLPVSSTAHLLIVQRVLGYQDPGGVFTVLIQPGSILAVMWLYRRRLLDTVSGVTSRTEARRFAVAILVAFVPAALAGALFSSFVKSVLYDSFAAIAVAFVAGGLVMLAVERWRPAATITEAEQTTNGSAAAIGVCQMLALVPGVSRSGATIVGGMLAGLDRRAAAEFSFFLAMPTMVGAFVHDAYEVKDFLTAERALEIGVGFLMAFVAAAIVVKPFLNIVTRSGFAPFAWYRIASGVVILVAVAAGWL